MKANTIYDIIGIGIGPFNLGLAALAHKIKKLNCIFFDQKSGFNWHPGLLLDQATVQVPYYADLITMADPTSRFSYLNYLHKNQELFRFAIHEKDRVTRKEYNVYCQWVAGKLSNMFFGMRCESVSYNKSSKIYTVKVRDTKSGSILTFRGKHVVIGVGSIPDIPACALPSASPNIIHSSDYLFHKERLLEAKKITIVGSGQSAAEIFYDLLQRAQGLESLHLITRSDFFPMDLSKFSLEMTSPDYIDYFFALPADKKKKILSRQNALFKGINMSLICDIHDALYALHLMDRFKKIGLFTQSELKSISKLDDHLLKLTFHHQELEKEFTNVSAAVVLATGYKQLVPHFIQPVKELIRFDSDGLYDVNKNYSIDSNNSIFVQNAELHTHGFNAPDLGMGPYRNMVILNSILGKEHFKPEKNVTFQKFGTPPDESRDQ
jgi:lysine N6-hydroxylase